MARIRDCHHSRAPLSYPGMFPRYRESEQPVGAIATGSEPANPCVQAAVAPRWIPPVQTIALVAFAALIIKIILALRTYGTNDVYAWEGFLNWSRYLGVDLYRATAYFNHPPFMLHVLNAMGWMSRTTGMPFSFWLRVPGIVADPITLILVWKLLGSRTQETSVRWALVLLAAAPSLILVSGFHGNTDTVMVMFLLLAVYLIERGREGLGGAAFAISFSIKVLPLITIPAIFLYLGSRSRRIFFFSAAGVALVLLWSPYIFQDPFIIAKNTLGYRSEYGHWGFSFLASHFLSPHNWINRIFRKLGAYMLLVIIVAITVWMSRMRPKPPLFSQLGLLFFLFLALTNGFGVQYLAWLAPWAVGLGVIPPALHFAASGAFVLVVYNYWSVGFPWYLADGVRIGGYTGHLDYFQLLAWISVLYLLVVAWRRLHAREPSVLDTARRAPLRGRRVGVTLCLFALVVLPVARQWRRDFRPLLRLDGDQVLRSIRSRQYSDLSSWLHTANRHRQAIAAARQSLELNPNNAEAQNIIAASSGALGLWDQAIESAAQALRIQPDLAPARKNLIWALNEKQQAKTAR